MPNTKWDINRWSLEEADELEKLAVVRGSADESARHVRGLYVTFLLFAFYIAVIVFATTDEQLLRETGARLPLLNVELPLLGFYIFIPWLVLIFHVHLLNQFFLLSRKLHNLNQAIALLPEDIQHKYRELPFPLVFSHMVVGTHYSRLLRWAFSLAVLVTVVIVPITLLLAIQWKFLRYHSSGITVNHQIVLVLDLFLLWVFWPRMFARSVRWGVWCPSRGLRWRVQQRQQIRRMFAASISTIIILVVSTLFLVPPGDGIEWFLSEEAKKAWREQVWHEKSRIMVRLLYKETWFYNFFHRNLDLYEKTLMRKEPSPELIAAYKAAGDPSEKVWLDHGKPLDLQNRDLRNADFGSAILWDVDFRKANLQGADFTGAELQGANLKEAQLQDADLFNANLQGAKLRGAQLQGADLWGVNLEGADLSRADLQGANLRYANLQGARLIEANLQGANLEEAQLAAASLTGANLQGADLTEAYLYGAFLNHYYDTIQGIDQVVIQGANLQGADLTDAKLQGAVLQGAKLQGANLSRANLQGTDLRGTRVYATDFLEADLSMADIRGLIFAPVEWEDLEIMEDLELELTSGAKNWPDDARRHVQKALSDFWNSAVFGPSFDKTLLTLPASSQAIGALYDHCGLFADWPPPPDIDTFETNHAALLAELPCNNEYLARSIVARAFGRRAPFITFKKLSPLPTLAQALLNKTYSKTCPEITAVFKEYREKLEQIAQQTKQPR